jgi:biotin-dependent carboxylase-like uncharacterized protein
MIKVLHPGFYSTIQDLGRYGYQEYGVPYSGVMDRAAAILVNTLLGNDDHKAVIEMTMTGVKLQFGIETCIAISGAHMSPKLNELPIEMTKIIHVKPNDVLSFGKLTKGFRCYLGVLGGFETKTVMQSRSMCKNITSDFMLRKHDELQISASTFTINKQHASIKFDSSYLDSKTIDVFKGPEFEYLSKNQQKTLFHKMYSISNDNNRMAYQLIETFENDLKPIITSAVLPGTVQLTPSGKLIVLMRDCQTTGGYPRVLQLKASALDVLAQKFTGNNIEFVLKT